MKTSPCPGKFALPMKNPVGDKKKRFDILIFEVIEYFSL